MTSSKRCRLSEEPPETSDERVATHIFKVLHHVLDNIEVTDLSLEDKHNLRVTCRHARDVVNEHFKKVQINHPDSILSDRKHAKTLRDSPLPLKAKKFYCGSSLSRNHMTKLRRIQFPNVEDAKITIDSDGLDRLPLRKWDKLNKLDLSVIWHYELHSLSTLNRFWRSFSKANWPLLETLTLKITPDRSSTAPYLVDDEVSSGQILRNPYVGGAVCLLSYLPKLKNLEIKTGVSLEDVQALAAVPHNNLKRLKLTFFRPAGLANFDAAAALAAAEWPRLQELSLSGFASFEIEDVQVFLTAPWFQTLTKLKLTKSVINLAAGTELISALQHVASSLEQLELSHCSTDIFAAFEHVELIKLKELIIRMERASRIDPRTEIFDFNLGLAKCFNTAKLPSLEFLNISQRAYYRTRSEYRTRAEHLSWNIEPTAAAMHQRQHSTILAMPMAMETETGEEDPFSIFPALKYLRISDIQIDRLCTKFLANAFFKRGTCDIDLGFAKVISGLDDEKLSDILEFYRVSQSEFDHEIRTLGLHNQVYWYNLLSMEELQYIASSLFLSNLAADLESVFEPAKKSMALVALAGGKDGLLEKRCQATREALQKLNTIVPKPTNACVAHCVGAAGASGSGGGGRGSRCGRKKRPPSPADAI